MHRGYDTFLDVLPTSASDTFQADLSQSHEIAIITTPLEMKTSEEMLLEPLAKLYVLGSEVNWPKLFPQGGRRVNLPLYPWQREHHWLRTRPVQVSEQ